MFYRIITFKKKVNSGRVCIVIDLYRLIAVAAEIRPIPMFFE